RDIPSAPERSRVRRRDVCCAWPPWTPERPPSVPPAKARATVAMCRSKATFAWRTPALNAFSSCGWRERNARFTGDPRISVSSLAILSVMKSLLLVSLLGVSVIAAPGTATQSAAPPPVPGAGASSIPFWTGMADAASFERAMDARLANARRLLGQLTSTKGAHTIENSLRPYDDLQLELDAVGSQAELIRSVHPDAKVREIAEKVSQRAAALATELSLNRDVFDAIKALDVSAADA